MRHVTRFIGFSDSRATRGRGASWLAAWSFVTPHSPATLPCTNSDTAAYNVHCDVVEYRSASTASEGRRH
jgi:hypothetical protein